MGAPAANYSKAKPGCTFFLLFQFIWMSAGLQLHHTFSYRDWSPPFAHWSPAFISRVYWHDLPFNTLLESLLLLVLMSAPLHLAVSVPCYWSKEQWFQMPFLLFSLPFLLWPEFRHLNLSTVLLWVWGWLGGTKQGYLISASDKIFLLGSRNKNGCNSCASSLIFPSAQSKTW